MNLFFRYMCFLLIVFFVSCRSSNYANNTLQSQGNSQTGASSKVVNNRNVGLSTNTFSLISGPGYYQIALNKDQHASWEELSLGDIGLETTNEKWDISHFNYTLENKQTIQFQFNAIPLKKNTMYDGSLLGYRYTDSKNTLRGIIFFLVNDEDMYCGPLAPEGVVKSPFMLLFLNDAGILSMDSPVNCEPLVLQSSSIIENNHCYIMSSSNSFMPLCIGDKSSTNH